MSSRIHVHLCVHLNTFAWERPHISRKRIASESSHVYCPCFYLLVVELSPRMSQLLKNMGEVCIQVKGPFTIVILCSCCGSFKSLCVVARIVRNTMFDLGSCGGDEEGKSHGHS